MKMLRITKGVTSDLFKKNLTLHTDLTDLFHKLQFYECSKIWNTNVSRVYNMFISLYISLYFLYGFM